MTQQEFTKILETEIRPFVSDLISNAPLHNDKQKYVSDSWVELQNKLTTYNFDEETFRDLNFRYKVKIEKEILG